MTDKPDDQPATPPAHWLRKPALQWLLLPALLLVLFTLVVRQLPGLDITQRPQPIAPTVHMGAMQSSYLALPITIPLDDLAQRLGENMPVQLVNKRIKTHGRHIRFKVRRTGELQLQGDHDRLRLLLPVEFDAEAPREGLFRPHMHTRGKIIVRADVDIGISSDWQPEVRVQPSFTWVKKPYIYLGPFKIHIAGVLGKQIQKALDKQARKLEEKTEHSLSLRHKAERAWQGLFEPKRLSHKPEAWLVMQPQSIHWQPPRSDANNLYLALGLVARLSTVLGAEPAALTPTPLPSLSKTLPDNTGFQLQVPVLLDYDALDAALRHSEAGRRIKLRNGSVRLRDFETYASGERLVLGVTFSARGFLGDWLNTRGKIYLTGIPTYAPDTRVLGVRDFDFTRRVDNWLVNSASWVLQERLRNALAGQLHWDATDRILKAQEDLTRDLNRPLGHGLYLGGEVTRLDLVGMQLTAQGIELRFTAGGEMALRYAAPPAPEPTAP